MMAVRWLIAALMLLVGLTLADQPLEEVLSADLDLSVKWDGYAKELRSAPVVEAPVTASRIVDVMINHIVLSLGKKGWNLQKTLPSVSGSVPIANTNKAIQVEITNGVYKNMGSIRRAKSAKIDVNEFEMTGTLGFFGLEFDGNFKISTPRIGEAPANTATGKVWNQAYKYFVDFVFLVDEHGLPVGIKSWKPRPGKLNYQDATALKDNKYKDIFNSLLKDSTRSLFNRLIEEDLFNLVKDEIIGKMTVQ